MYKLQNVLIKQGAGKQFQIHPESTHDTWTHMNTHDEHEHTWRRLETHDELHSWNSKSSNLVKILPIHVKLRNSWKIQNSTIPVGALICAWRPAPPALRSRSVRARQTREAGSEISLTSCVSLSASCAYTTHHPRKMIEAGVGQVLSANKYSFFSVFQFHKSVSISFLMFDLKLNLVLWTSTPFLQNRIQRTFAKLKSRWEKVVLSRILTDFAKCQKRFLSVQFFSKIQICNFVHEISVMCLWEWRHDSYGSKKLLKHFK